MNKAVAAHRQAESKLNQLLFDCEQRDQALQLRESRLEKEKEDAQREAERKITEMEDTCRRVREEYVHQCALENARLQDISTENARMRERLVRSNTYHMFCRLAFDTRSPLLLPVGKRGGVSQPRGGLHAVQTCDERHP